MPGSPIVHLQTGPDGVAKYPLPATGQTDNLPRILGGRRRPGPDEEPLPPAEPKYWKEGWYVMVDTNVEGSERQFISAKLNLQQQQRNELWHAGHKELWEEYQTYLRQHPEGPQPGPDNSTHKFWGPNAPTKPRDQLP